ncbi:MAG: hypothetical protein ABI402_01185 [Ferruginibacter sp.]
MSAQFGELLPTLVTQSSILFLSFLFSKENTSAKITTRRFKIQMSNSWLHFSNCIETLL